jgi:hypothetical protein
MKESSSSASSQLSATKDAEKEDPSKGMAEWYVGAEALFCFAKPIACLEDTQPPFLSLLTIYLLFFAAASFRSSP